MNISIVDSHCHVYPEAIAARAVEGIGSFYNIPMNLDGTVDCLLKRMDEGHIDHAVISSCATRPAQVSPINRFLAEAMKKSGGRLTALGTMHPDSPDQQADFDEILSLGLHGVKMHHDFQRVAVDDPRCYPIYELCSCKVPMLLHTGDNRYDYTNPDRVAPVLREFPELRVVGAHLGGWSIWEEAVKTLGKFDNFCVDCSSSLYALTPEAASRVIEAYGTDRVLFGSDYPMWNPAGELERFSALGFGEEDARRILSDNARRVYGIGNA